MRRLLACLLLLLPLAACAGGGLFSDGRAKADRLAAEAGFSRATFATRQFDIRGYYRLGNPADPRLAVFIEGDGVAYIGFKRSGDPTPENPVALEVAISDATPNRLYLARPCQFTEEKTERNCSSDLWASHRMSADVVSALNQALDQFLRRSNSRQIILHGYSGGGGVAVLMAADRLSQGRNDVQGLVTLAGVIDHAAWTQHFGDTPLWGSLNPVDAAPKLRAVPQRHFIGAKDDQVPPQVAQSYRQRAGAPPGIVVSVPDTDHFCCWAKQWPALARLPLIRPDGN